MSENKLNEILRHRAEQVRAGALIVAEKTNDWQQIKRYITNRMEEHELTPKQREKFDRYQFIYNQLVTGKYTEADVVFQLKRLFKVSPTQAYEDIAATREVFLSTISFNRNFEIKIELEIAKAARAKLLEVQNFKEARAYHKVIMQLMEMMPEEADHPGMDFEGHQLEAVFDPRLLGAPDVDMEAVLKVINENRKVPINIDMFTHLNYEDVPADGSTETSL